jgi:hypothetical protein
MGLKSNHRFQPLLSWTAIWLFVAHLDIELP